MADFRPHLDPTGATEFEDGFTAYQATMQLLKETQAYLSRLPVVLETRELSLRIEAHMLAVTRAHDCDPAEMEKRVRRTLQGGAYTAAGVAMIEVQYVDHRVYLRTPKTPLFDAIHARSLINRLHQGLNLTLKPTGQE